MIAPAAALLSAAALMAPATAVVDRTVSCEAGLSGSLPKFAVWSFSAVRTGPQKHGPSADVRSEVVPAWRLAYISESELMLSPACKITKATVPLTAKGLSGGESSIFGEPWPCLSSARLLIRVRGTFAAPAALRPGSIPSGFAPVRMLIARGDVSSAQLAVRTPSGKPLAFASFGRKGKTHVYMARRCNG
jgi:hypothetical protein